MKSPLISSQHIVRFKKTIYRFYEQHGRKFPWRETRNPCHILVSEIMLQQTQTERVIEKFKHFITVFPDFSSLACAPLKDILMLWQGLGYNRRAKALKTIAQKVIEEFHGKLPREPHILQTLPGIGRATAASIAAFAFNQPVLFIETNIRCVYIHFFFRNKTGISDEQIFPLLEKTLDRNNPRKWYNALMDYGVMLKKKFPNLNERSAHYKKQSPFLGSDRQIRGFILKHLVEKKNIQNEDIVKRFKIDKQRLGKILDVLHKEGWITRRGNGFTLSQHS